MPESPPTKTPSKISHNIESEKIFVFAINENNAKVTIEIIAPKTKPFIKPLSSLIEKKQPIKTDKILIN